MTDILELPLFVDHTDAITALIYNDPIHARDREAIVEAIRADARAHDNNVNPNRVRVLIPSWVQPQLIGAAYRNLKVAGVLETGPWTVNEDAKGRNCGKPARTYQWVGQC